MEAGSNSTGPGKWCRAKFLPGVKWKHLFHTEKVFSGVLCLYLMHQCHPVPMKLLLQQQPRWFNSSKACSCLFFFVIFSLRQSLTDFVTAERMLIGYSTVRLDVGLQILWTGAQLKDMQDFGPNWPANDNTILSSLQWSSTSSSSTDCTQIRRMHKSLMIPFLVQRGWESNWS